MRQKHRFALCAGLGLVALGASGCLPSISDLDQGPLTSTFAVSDYFTPSGFMGDGQYFGNLVGTTNQDCKLPRPAAEGVGAARGNCYKFTYYPNQIDKDAWAGVFWVFPANSWGSTYGHAIDMTKFKRVSFFAAIEAPTPYTVDGSPQPFNGLVGGIDPGNQFTPWNYADGAKASTSAAIGTALTSEYKQFHIALTDFNKGSNCKIPFDPSTGVADNKAENCADATDEMGQPIRIANDLIGAFGWSLHYPNDSATCLPPPPPAPGEAPLPATWCQSGQHSSQFVNPKPVVVYLDDIVWETQ
jgi:hypothetical protein